jgi:hypothetical protein
VREAEGGFCAPVCQENVGAQQRFRGERKDFSLKMISRTLNADQAVGRTGKKLNLQPKQGARLDN